MAAEAAPMWRSGDWIRTKLQREAATTHTNHANPNLTSQGSREDASSHCRRCTRHRQDGEAPWKLICLTSWLKPSPPPMKRLPTFHNRKVGGASGGDDLPADKGWLCVAPRNSLLRVIKESKLLLFLLADHNNNYSFLINLFVYNWTPFLIN